MQIKASMDGERPHLFKSVGTNEALIPKQKIVKLVNKVFDYLIMKLRK